GPGHHFPFLQGIPFLGKHGVFRKVGHKGEGYGDLMGNPEVGDAVAQVLLKVIAKGKASVQVEPGSSGCSVELVIAPLDPTQFGEVQNQPAPKDWGLLAIEPGPCQGKEPSILKNPRSVLELMGIL